MLAGVTRSGAEGRLLFDWRNGFGADAYCLDWFQGSESCAGLIFLSSHGIGA